MTLFVEHHDGDAGNGLAHRADSKDSVGPHGFCRFAILHALCFEPCHLAVPDNQRDGTRDAMVVDRFLNRGADAIEALGGKADGLRLGNGKVLGDGTEGENQNE